LALDSSESVHHGVLHVVGELKLLTALQPGCLHLTFGHIVHDFYDGLFALLDVAKLCEHCQGLARQECVKSNDVQVVKGFVE